jgi:hypothetical protein
MSGTENSATWTLEECLHLGAGFAVADRPTGAGMSQTSKVIAPGRARRAQSAGAPAAGNALR